MWEVLVQGIWPGAVQWIQTECEDHGFASAEGFASA